jgi:hypothetical protein
MVIPLCSGRTDPSRGVMRRQSFDRAMIAGRHQARGSIVIPAKARIRRRASALVRRADLLPGSWPGRRTVYRTGGNSEFLFHFSLAASFSFH